MLREAARLLRVVKGYMKIWKWLWILAVGLILLGAFGPLSDPWDRISLGFGTALSLTNLGAEWWDHRKHRDDQSDSPAISSSDSGA